MGYLAYDRQLGAMSGKHSYFTGAINDMLDGIQKHLYLPVPASFFRYYPSPSIKRLNKAIDHLQQIGASFVEVHFLLFLFT